MIRFGIIGTNWITERFLDAANQIDDFRLTAVYSRREETAHDFANKYGVAKTFTDLEAFAKNTDIDAVYIASPNSFHKEQAILCMKQGKHVLVEKAIASNVREVKVMFEVAKQNNVLLMEAVKSTHLNGFKAIQKHLPKIGKARRYFASYCQYSSRYDAYKEGTVLNAFKPEFSNGALMDIGIYCIYPMVALFGKPSEIKATSYMLESGVDGQGNIVFDYSDVGMNGVVMYSKITDSYLPSEIQGENGSILIDKISEPSNVEIKYRDGSTEKVEVNQANENTMYDEVAHFIELIKDGKLESAVNSFENSLITIGIIEEARKQIGLSYSADKIDER
ncbi:Gfo/Idh/MocA family protein [Aquibacillus salsiterrae]|uniref:Gfo/Idh/MocA family oxidoreductase n=1 Tax=Aquibacillus salsiterrae TaxID=2950439 RepID=A0A9X3WCU6_9BACI|nr:Gfo/Idh/MocA family oxidoreductase [Aquibacillus salsiterrae]MDC3417497.1 Gfo/Idh/MocA family oxidoreductase [Aquibacillus salsiterrae]